MMGTRAFFARRLLAWYGRARRDLPWRVALGAPPDARPDPYHVLVSEAMLQQTQVATVIPYFRRFIERFPTLSALAEADEQDVLRLWQGLGYYARARHLRRAAQAVIATCGGELPCDVAALRALPGIGRYTAGAIASLAFDRRAPILDGNVARVLCRIDRIETDPRTPATQTLLWERAEALLSRSRPGDFNSALMELGATVCVPRSPQCLICPVRGHCEARAAGIQDRIPAPRQKRITPQINRTVWCVPDASGRWLIEQRPATGRWAGMWQFLTTSGGPPDGLNARRINTIGTAHHALTHRRYTFEVVLCRPLAGAAARQAATLAPAGGPVRGSRRWATFSDLEQYPLPRPHSRIARLLRERMGEATALPATG